MIEVDTERLRLRQWCPADREPFTALNADPRVMEFLPAPLDRAESDAMADPLPVSYRRARLGLLGRRAKGKPGVHRVCRLARSWFRVSVLSLCRSRLAPCLSTLGEGFRDRGGKGGAPRRF